MPNLLASHTAVARAPATVRRSTLAVFDLFRRVDDKKGRLYMHVGTRTNPPSGGRTTGTIVGYQAVIVDGPHKAGSDGASVTFDVNQLVVPVGKAEVHAKLYA